ncbi:uncharacterized protein F5891DRAFT_980381 [Suillus fuscotomentosus]|uniref:Ribonucleotide reductase large subunit C-terminal domain-containing protein n=1 Tax=Suillus fuscotomentosus TaxID=1912939 RepID=A0AAD4E6E3_9AGAM|nr:uncharacterized protein F5891DRAFT_980381 [Suillus fuscotomentosus]KAG1900440.1 hypothetical protein F5891DRAFT_980381 [Suillus fuscotomentosus]
MPTVSTSQILSFNGALGPTSVSTLAVSSLVNSRLNLVDCGLCNDDMKNMIIAHNGSVTNISSIPNDTKTIYKTIWEISQRKSSTLLPTVEHSSPTVCQLTSMARSEIGMYYLGTCPAAQAVQFTIDQNLLKHSYSSPLHRVSLPSNFNDNGVTPSSSGPSGANKVDPEYAAALGFQRESKLEEAKMMCSLENKEACLTCSGQRRCDRQDM